MHLPNVPLDSDLSLLRDSLVNYHTERLWAEQDRRARRRSRQGAGGFSLKRSIENMGYGALDGGDRELL
jgi:hypothetical protein